MLCCVPPYRFRRKPPNAADRLGGYPSYGISRLPPLSALAHPPRPPARRSVGYAFAVFRSVRARQTGAWAASRWAVVRNPG